MSKGGCGWIGVGILRVGENFALHPGERAEVVIKGVVLFGDDDYMCDGRGHELLYLYAPRRVFQSGMRAGYAGGAAPNGSSLVTPPGSA
jgi:hypothetical protein